jgi:demethylmenaquinone methyltransferase/2-methoxy-6-polyprenyl-1,4-benzoquinol methylase
MVAGSGVASGAGDDEILAEQRLFYDRRAPEYDEWWQRRGRYDHGPEERASWDRQVAIVEQALADFDASGAVLELAGGTGWWTSQLLQTAERLTVVDSSAEALAINRRRHPDAGIRYVEHDLFTWSTNDRYDLIFFSFWLSHVPRPRFSRFWAMVASLLRPDGRAFLIDNRHDRSISRPDPYVIDHRDDVQVRNLSDGSQHRVVKVFYEPDDLERLLRREGWGFSLSATPQLVYGGGHPVDK